MAESKKEPQASAETPGADQDTFLFMGKRIPLGSAAPKRAPESDNLEPKPATSGTAGSPATEVGSKAAEPYYSSKASFDLDPLHSSKPGASRYIFVIGAGLLLVGVALFFAWHRFGSTEARIIKAARSGQTVSPQGDSAYDLYKQLRAEQLSPVVMSRLRREVLPLLSSQGDALLKKLYSGSALTQSELDKLALTYEWAADLDPQDGSLLARHVYANGCRALSRKAESEALSAFTQALQADSQWVLPFRELAKLHAKSGDYGTAEYYFEQASKLDPKWALPQLELAGLYFERNRLPEAEAGYRRAAVADPTHPAPWYFLGQLYERQKKKADAIAAYERAAQLATEHLPSGPTADEIRAALEKLRQS
jgi:Tetratricopeptide repeat